MERREVLRRAGEWVLSGGALLAILTSVLASLDRGDEHEQARYIDACRRAEAALLDDRLNTAMTDAEKRAFVQRKLRIASRCDKDGER